jgi:succinoglycan biosynthesis transport protein ExoP
LRSTRNLPVLAVSATPTVSAPSIPQDFASPGLSQAQIFSIVHAYRVHAAIIAGVFLVASALYTKTLPKTYLASATLLVNTESSDPLAAGQARSAATPFFSYMSTEVQLMQSAEVLLPVIDKLKLTSNKDYTNGYRGNGSDLREWVKENLIKDLIIELGPASSQLIYINASARDPQLAAQLANTVADTYLEQERQRTAGPASERAKRYSQELGELKDKVRIAQDQVTAFRQRTGVTDSATHNGNVEAELLASLETRLQEAQNARRAAEVKSGTEQNLSTVAAGSTAIQTLKTQINTETAQLAQLRATLGAQHPKVLELQYQIDANKRNLASEINIYSAGAKSDLVAARQLEQKLRAAVEEQRAKVLAISRLQDEGTKFVLELESAQSVYKRALDGYDQIMFAAGGHAVIVNMVSRAVPPQKASKPNKPKLVLLGGIMGLFLGIFGPIGYELTINRRVRCRDDFERGFAVPVLIEFDPIPAARSFA